MGRKVTKLPEIASRTIDDVLEEFLEEQRKRLKPRTVSTYENVISLLKDQMNVFGHVGLSKAESALFDRYYNAGLRTPGVLPDIRP